MAVISPIPFSWMNALPRSGLILQAFSQAIDLADNLAHYARENAEAQARGVFGAPTFIVDDQIFWGNDRIVWVEDYLRGR